MCFYLVCTDRNVTVRMKLCSTIVIPIQLKVDCTVGIKKESFAESVLSF